MAPRKVSILIPTLDGERDLQRLLPALERQEFDGDVERIAIDSGSRDSTRTLLKGAGFDVTEISRDRFGHGRTRNDLANRATGEALVFLSQDATPRSADFLTRITDPLQDQGVAGVMARVMPQADDDPLTARTVGAAPEASETAWVHRLEAGRSLRSYDPAERRELTRFNNVASCIRASVLRTHPFPEIPFGEDIAWAAQALEAGHAITFEPRAVVAHAHRYGPSSAYRRYRTDAEFNLAFHGHPVRPSLWALARGVAYECRADMGFLLRSRGPGRLRAAVRSPFLRTGQVLGQYRGSHSRTEEWSSAIKRGAFVPLTEPTHA